MLYDFDQRKPTTASKNLDSNISVFTQLAVLAPLAILCFSLNFSHMHWSWRISLLPPAYIVRREGNSFTLLVCPHLGGYPYPIMLCNISQNAMGQPPGGVPCQVQLGGVPCQVQPGGYPARGYPAGGHPAGGYPARGVLGGTQVRYPPRQVRTGGGTQLGQHREYLLHGRRYASCVHAGGLSCLIHNN